MKDRSVLIADTNTRLSRLIGQLLADEPGFQVLGVHSTAAEAWQAAQERRPDLVLLSERLDGRPVDDLCDRLRTLVPEVVLVMWSHDPATRGKGQPLADAVVERGTTFRRFVGELRAIADRAHAPDRAPLTWVEESVRALPPLPSGELVDDPQSSGALLLQCDTCAVQVRIATDDVAPAVDEARDFFAEHAECVTAIDRTERRVLSPPA